MNGQLAHYLDNALEGLYVGIDAFTCAFLVWLLGGIGSVGIDVVAHAPTVASRLFPETWGPLAKYTAALLHGSIYSVSVGVCMVSLALVVGQMMVDGKVTDGKS